MKCADCHSHRGKMIKGKDDVIICILDSKIIPNTLGFLEQRTHLVPNFFLQFVSHETSKTRIPPVSFISNISPFIFFIKDTPTTVTTATSSGNGLASVSCTFKSTGAIFFTFKAMGALSTKSPRFLNCNFTGVYSFFVLLYS